MFPVPTKPILPELPEFSFPDPELNALDSTDLLIAEARTPRAVEFLHVMLDVGDIGRAEDYTPAKHSFMVWLQSGRQPQAQAVRQYLLDAWNYFLATGEYPTTKGDDDGSQ